MSNQPNPAEGIFRVTYCVRRNGKISLEVGDLIFHEGAPILVLEWGALPGQVLAGFLLDPEQLASDPTNPQVFVYQGPLEDPRPVH